MKTTANPSLKKSASARVLSALSGLLLGHARGQSYIELALLVPILMVLVGGIAEYGLLLNDYLNLVDSSREAVRFSSGFDPFDEDGNVDTDFFVQTSELTEQVLLPLVLDPALGDDIVITFFSIGNGIYIREPNVNGWSVYGNQASKLTDSEVQARLDVSAPPAGILIVEIFYNYPQRLHLPVFTQLVADPIPVHIYAVMPLPAAEPVTTPVGGGGGFPTATDVPPLPTNTSAALPTNTSAPLPTATATSIPVNSPTPTSSPTATATATNTATPTKTNTPNPTATVTNTPTPTATSFVCSVSGSDFYMVNSRRMATSITNNTGETLHISFLTLFFNDSPAAQLVNRIRWNGSNVWTGTINGSPASGAIELELAPWSSNELEFRFGNNYTTDGSENLLVDFAENGCSSLSVP